MMLNISHSPHIGGEVKNKVGTFAGDPTRLKLSKIGRVAFDIGELLMPSRKRFDIDGSQILIALPSQLSDDMPADEATRTC